MEGCSSAGYDVCCGARASVTDLPYISRGNSIMTHRVIVVNRLFVRRTFWGASHVAWVAGKKVQRTSESAMH
jgi:hypothetical protein